MATREGHSGGKAVTDYGDGYAKKTHRIYTQAELDAAVKAEREACAKVAIVRASELAEEAPTGGQNAEGSHSRVVAEGRVQFRKGIRRAGVGIAAAIRERGG